MKASSAAVPRTRFRDPDGYRMALYYEEQKYRAPDHLRSTLKNLPMKYTARGVNVRRIDHLALLARSVPENRKFAQQTLGFALREQVILNGGKQELGSPGPWAAWPCRPPRPACRLRLNGAPIAALSRVRCRHRSRTVPLRCRCKRQTTRSRGDR